MQQKAVVPQETRAERAIRFVHTFCRVPEGEFVGQPLILEDFQQDFYRGILSPEMLDGVPRKIRRAIWSMARKNAKTVTIATLILVFLVGPEAQHNAQIVSGAMSRDQASLVFDACCKIINMSPELSRLIKIVPSSKTLIGLPRNVTYKALSAEGKTTHGLSPLVIICDELGQVIGPKSDFFDALVTSQGAHKDPLLVIISTQAASDSDLLSILIDDALISNDPTIYCKVFEAPENCSVMDEKAWEAANPALGKFRNREDVRQLAIQASRMPSAEATFRNLILNQRISTSSPYVSRSVWKQNAGNLDSLLECEEFYAGLDLSGKFDLTAFVLLGRCGTKWNIYPYFWMPENGILERSKRDRVSYDVWIQQGFIQKVPGASVDYEYVVHALEDITSPISDKIKGIAYDRWRIEVLKKECERLGLELPLIEWGQGFKDMSPALDALEEILLNAEANHNSNPVLNNHSNNARVVKSPAGDRKLDKIKTSGRIDGMVALAMAAGIAERQGGMGEGNINDFIFNPIVIK